MKNKIFIYFDRIILMAILILGFTFCDTSNEYGGSYADFEINGTVTDSVTSTPVANIKVIRITNLNSETGKPVFTDNSGKFKITFRDFPEVIPTFTLKFEDTDGAANGGEFKTRNVVVTFANSDWIDDGDDNLYYGKARKTQNIKLQYK